jgi:hypothetical protein
MPEQEQVVSKSLDPSNPMMPPILVKGKGRVCDDKQETRVHVKADLVKVW